MSKNIRNTKEQENTGGMPERTCKSLHRDWCWRLRFARRDPEVCWQAEDRPAALRSVQDQACEENEVDERLPRVGPEQQMVSSQSNCREG